MDWAARWLIWKCVATLNPSRTGRSISTSSSLRPLDFFDLLDLLELVVCDFLSSSSILPLKCEMTLPRCSMCNLSQVWVSGPCMGHYFVTLSVAGIWRLFYVPFSKSLDADRSDGIRMRGSSSGDIEVDWGREICIIPSGVSCCFNIFSNRAFSTILWRFSSTTTANSKIKDVFTMTLRVIASIKPMDLVNLSRMCNK